MKKIQLILLVVITLGFVTKNYGQRRNVVIANGVGVYGGITQFDIKTNNFETQKKQGWILGLSATGDLPHKWYNVSYNIQFSENQIGIQGRASNTDLSPQQIDYKVFAAQVVLLMHLKAVENHVTIDLGPMLQYNSKLEFKNNAQENYLLSGYTNLLARDITDISNFNFNGLAGISLGIGHFQLKAHYIYGFTNILNKLNDSEPTSGLNERFKGNQSMVMLTAMVTF